MKIKKIIYIKKKKINGTVNVPGSKSLANRILLLSALAPGISKIFNIPNNDDVNICLQVIKSLGINVKYLNKSTVIIYGCNKKLPVKYTNIFCGNSGTLSRFIIPICALQNNSRYYIYSSYQMSNRPIKEELEFLEKLGIKIVYCNIKYKFPFIIYGNNIYIKNNLFDIDCTKSSQFISAILIASTLFIGNEFKIKALVNHALPYVNITLNYLKNFGVNIKTKYFKEKILFNLKINKQLQPKNDNYYIETDAATASYFWAVAAITSGSVKVNNIFLKSLQPDIKFLSILQKMGCKILEHKDGIEVIGSKNINGIKINMKDSSDTFMTVAVIACFATSSSHIFGLSHTKFQESNRLLNIYNGLCSFGVKCNITKDSLHIYPQQSSFKNGNIIYPQGDHRIAMSLSLLGLRIKETFISSFQCIEKTCPEFFYLLDKLILNI